MFQNVSIFNDYYVNENLFFGIEKFKKQREVLLNRYNQDLEPHVIDVFFLEHSLHFQITRDLFEQTKKRPESRSQIQHFIKSFDNLLTIAADYPDLFADEIENDGFKNAFGLIKVFLQNVLNVDSVLIRNLGITRSPFQWSLVRKEDGFWAIFDFDVDLFNHILFLSIIDHYEHEVLWLQKSTKKIVYDHHAIRVGNFIAEINPGPGIEFNPVENHSYFGDNKDFAVVESNYHISEKGSRIFLRALARQRYRSNYHFVSYNCEHFASFCFYGVPRSKQLRFLGMYLLFILGALTFGKWTFLLTGPFIFLANRWHRDTYVFKTEEEIKKVLFYLFLASLLGASIGAIAALVA